MLTRFKSSLTLRIFLITSALLVAACGITYGAIAYLTPISYTSLLADELSRETDALVVKLRESTAESCEGLLQDFAKQTGANMRLTDEHGHSLYDTIPAIPETSAAFEDGVAMETDDTATQDSSTTETSKGLPWVISTATEEAVVPVIEQVITTNSIELSDGSINFIFSDGSGAFLLVQGGTKAVNQAAEAMGQILPFLLLIVVGISLLASFFYARFITKPIVSISRIAKRIANLDFDACWQKSRADEIGALGDNLNLLSANLSESLSKLEKANQALQRDIERERELDRQRLAFFSAASHELKTPVTILKGQLSGMLAQVGVYRDREKYLARSLEVTSRMEGLIKEILTISRIESGSFALNAISVDLGKLMEKQLALDEELIEQKQLIVDSEIEPSVMITGNESLLSNALDNVLMNAILYSPPSALIRIRVDAHSFSIENSGVSIPEKALSQLFTPFYRVEQSRNRKSGGSGLGLYLVKSILELHGASCCVENTAEGVRFMARFG